MQLFTQPSLAVTWVLQYGVKGSELNQFDNYLSSRTQFTEVNGYTSYTQTGVINNTQ